MPQIRPITDLRNTTDISAVCHSSNEPIFITKNGYGDMVIMSIETFESLFNSIDADIAIYAAESELKESGQLHDAKKALESLRRKYFG